MPSAPLAAGATEATPRLVAAARPRSPGLARRIWRKRFAYALLLPTFLLLLVFRYYPAASAIYHSLFRWDGVNRPTFVGLQNFAALLADPVVRVSTRNVLVLLLSQLAVTLTVPLLTAELIFGLRSPRLQYWFRMLFVVPMVVPLVVTLLVWRFIYNPIYGPLNHLLGLVGVVPVAWLGDSRTALLALIFIGFPWVSGFALLIFLAGLQNVPQDIWDAGEVDGARGLTRFLHLDLPLILPQVRLLSVLVAIGVIQGFGLPLVLTNGGPGYATMVPGLHMFNIAFVGTQMGYASAIGTAMFLVILAITYLNLRYLRSSVEFEA